MYRHTFYIRSGIYNVSAYLENAVSNYSTWVSVPVQRTIQGFATWLVQEQQGKMLSFFHENNFIRISRLKITKIRTSKHNALLAHSMYVYQVIEALMMR